jgi:hypothetical protein
MVPNFQLKHYCLRLRSLIEQDSNNNFDEKIIIKEKLRQSKG